MIGKKEAVFLLLDCGFTCLGWVERNGVYVDLKFKRLKEVRRATRCLGLVEVPQVDLQSVKDWVGAVMLHADWMAYTMEEFKEAIGHHANEFH